MFSSSRSTVGCAAVMFYLASTVSAHGWIDHCVTGGKNYTGNFPIDQDQGTPQASPIWQALTEDPVVTVNTSTLACNSQASLKPSVLATVDAGSSMSLTVRITFNNVFRFNFLTLHFATVGDWLRHAGVASSSRPYVDVLGSMRHSQLSRRPQHAPIFQDRPSWPTSR